MSSLTCRMVLNCLPALNPQLPTLQCDYLSTVQVWSHLSRCHLLKSTFLSCSKPPHTHTPTHTIRELLIFVTWSPRSPFWDPIFQPNRTLPGIRRNVWNRWLFPFFFLIPILFTSLFLRQPSAHAVSFLISYSLQKCPSLCQPYFSHVPCHLHIWGML